MAGKIYKMLMNFSNGSTIDAGQFITPQGASVLRADTDYQQFTATIPRTAAYPNGVTLYGGELIIWANGDCSQVTSSDDDTITSEKLVKMNLKGAQGEAGGDTFCKIHTISSSGTDLNTMAGLTSNPNVFCAKIVLPDPVGVKFALFTGSLAIQTNLVYLQIMRSVINNKWTYYQGITFDGSNYTTVIDDLGNSTNAVIKSLGSPISLYGAYFKY